MHPDSLWTLCIAQSSKNGRARHIRLTVCSLALFERLVMGRECGRAALGRLLHTEIQ